MPLPFDERGLLPPGVHDATLDEIDAVLGRFQKTTRRITLMNHLREYVGELRRTGWDSQLVIDGSFVMTAIDEPNDIDAILVLPADWKMDGDLRPSEYNLVSKRSTKQNYKIEVFAAIVGSEKADEFESFFGGVRKEWIDRFGWDPSSRKGLIRVIL